MRPKREPNCIICGRDSYAIGYCRTHYENNRRTGDPLGSRYKKVKATCLEDDCAELAATKGRCARHYAKWYYHNRPVGPLKRQKDAPSYAGAHNRIRYARGHARDYLCACGCGAQADNWALKAGTGNILLGSIGRRETKSAYSLNPYDYQPMTAACHKAYDARTGNRNYKTKKRDAA